MTPELELELVLGGALRIERIEGERVVVESARAFPPGATLTFRLKSGAAPSDDGTNAGVVYQVKVRGCRRTTDDGAFRIEGRFVSLSRAARELLQVR